MIRKVTPERIAADARWLIQGLDVQKQLVRIISMSADDYREASFLDWRMLDRPRQNLIQPWSDVLEASERVAAPPARWIFHVGHVGSTLVARLLGELGGVLSVREPGALRDIFGAPHERRAAYAKVLAPLFARRFADQQHVVVKATSFVSELASALAGGSTSLMMYTGPRRYIASILSGPNSRRELATLAGYRSGRLARRYAGPPPAGANEAALAALAWVTEMTSLEAAADALGEANVSWIDFDRDFLADPHAALQSAAHHLGIAASASEVSASLSGPIMSRYSKDPRQAFDAERRHELLATASRDHGADIKAAMDMIEGLARDFPLLARALDRCAGP